jgi:tetratricopeptide (TPR) repeat protein
VSRRSASEIIEAARALGLEAQSKARGTDPAQPLSLCDRAIAQLTPLGPTEALADMLRQKGSILRDCGDHARALDLYAQSLAIADAIFYTVGRAYALNCFGTMEQCRGDLKRAVSWYRSAQRLADGLGDRNLNGIIRQNLGIAAATAGNEIEALEHFRAALTDFEQGGDDQATLWVLNNMGNLYTRMRAYDKADRALHGALELARMLGDAASEGIVEENRARLLLATGKLDAAQEAAERALGIAALRRDPTRQAAALWSLGCVKRHRSPGSPEVLALLEGALELAQQGADAEIKAEILREIASSCEDGGDQLRARSYRQAAISIEADSGGLKVAEPIRPSRDEPGQEPRPEL